MPKEDAETIEPPPAREPRRKRKDAGEEAADEAGSGSRYQDLNDRVDEYMRDEAGGVECQGRVGERISGLYDSDDLRGPPPNAARKVDIAYGKGSGPARQMKCRGCDKFRDWSVAIKCSTHECNNYLCEGCHSRFQVCCRCWNRPSGWNARPDKRGRKPEDYKQRREQKRAREPLGLARRPHDGHIHSPKGRGPDERSREVRRSDSVPSVQDRGPSPRRRSQRRSRSPRREWFGGDVRQQQDQERVPAAGHPPEHDHENVWRTRQRALATLMDFLADERPGQK